LIIDVSSVAAFGASTLFPIYAATKAFNLSLSQSVAAGHKDKIECMAVTPDATATNMNSGTSLFSVNADTHVNCVLNQIGWT
jgi:short-subunit dehydrogenase